MARKTILAFATAVILLAPITIAWLTSDESKSIAAPLMISRQPAGSIAPKAVSPTNIFPDFYERKYPRTQRAQFQVSASEPAAIFVYSSGVEVLTDTGWKPFSEEPRNEIWRLKPGTAQDMFVEIPKSETEHWRAYIRYGSEMSGPPLLKVQLRGAWKTRSFANWNGAAWGGGHFSGHHQLLSAEYSN